MPFIGFTKSATKKGAPDLSSKCGWAIIPMTPVKASFTGSQFEPTNRFKCTSLTHPPYAHTILQKKRLNDWNIPLSVISPDMHRYQFTSQYGWGNEIEDTKGETETFHVLSWHQHWFSWVAHTFKFIVLCNNDKTRLRRIF